MATAGTAPDHAFLAVPAAPGRAYHPDGVGQRHSHPPERFRHRGHRAPAEPWRSAIPLRKLFLSPELEHEEGPQNAGVIAAAGHVVAHEPLDGSRIEQA